VPLIPPFWQRAARHSGRVDFGAVLRRAPDGLDRLDAAGLQSLGVPLQVAVALAGGGGTTIDADALTLADARYPALLRQLVGAPPILYTRGDPSLLTRRGVAIVGARRCTPSGKANARALARAVADAGGLVVSGLAWGIDSAAHDAAPGATVAVLGQGLGVKLGGPQGRLADEIVAAGGLVVSEFPPDQPPARWTFPQRNRIIAGLATVVVVVEAGVGSGSLITARWAADLGRDVMAVPGSPSSDASVGCLDLIEAGARMVRGSAGVLDAAGLRGATLSDPTHQTVLAAMVGPTSYDLLLGGCGLPMSALDRVLAALELTGQVERLPGDRYRCCEQAG
jgi:DNA processing protein